MRRGNGRVFVDGHDQESVALAGAAALETLLATQSRPHFVDGRHQDLGRLFSISELVKSPLYKEDSYQFLADEVIDTMDRKRSVEPKTKPVVLPLDQVKSDRANVITKYEGLGSGLAFVAILTGHNDQSLAHAADIYFFFLERYSVKLPIVLVKKIEGTEQTKHGYLKALDLKQYVSQKQKEGVQRLRQLTEDLKESKNEMKGVRSRNRFLEGKHEGLVRANHQSATLLAEARNSIRDSEAHIDKLTRSLNAQNTRAQGFEQELNTYQAYYQESSVALQRSEQTEEGLRAEIERLQAELENARTNYTLAVNQLDQYGQRAEQAERAQQQFDQEVSHVQDQLGDWREREATLNKKINTLQNEIDRLIWKIEESSVEKKAVSEALAVATQEREKLSTYVVQLESEVAHLKAEYTQLTAAHREIQNSATQTDRQRLTSKRTPAERHDGEANGTQAKTAKRHGLATVPATRRSMSAVQADQQKPSAKRTSAERHDDELNGTQAKAAKPQDHGADGTPRLFRLKLPSTKPVRARFFSTEKFGQISVDSVLLELSTFLMSSLKNGAGSQPISVLKTIYEKLAMLKSTFMSLGDGGPQSPETRVYELILCVKFYTGYLIYQPTYNPSSLNDSSFLKDAFEDTYIDTDLHRNKLPAFLIVSYEERKRNVWYKAAITNTRHGQLAQTLGGLENICKDYVPQIVVDRLQEQASAGAILAYLSNAIRGSYFEQILYCHVLIDTLKEKELDPDSKICDWLKSYASGKHEKFEQRHSSVESNEPAAAAAAASATI